MSKTSEAGPIAGTTGRLAPAARRQGAPRAWRWLALWLGASMLAACVTVEAPDEPIVIQLDLNIKQEVVYRLSEDAGNTIKQNPEIF
jgi:YnbE-like lipoprotein